MSQSIARTYTDHYLSHNPTHIYPTEWVVRTLLGDYPTLSMDRSTYRGGTILDVGFGDGRNWPLLNDIGFEIHGIEIAEAILDLGRQRARSLGIPVELNLGTNASIPYGDGFFDYLLACHSCYYIDAGKTFTDTLREYARILKPGGTAILSLAEATAAIFDGCLDLGEGHVEIRNDPWGLRSGSVFRRFYSADEVATAFSPYFESLSLGHCRDDYYGIQINFFLLVCRKRPAT